MASFRSPFERSPLATIGGIIISLVVLYVMFSIVGWVVSLLYKFSWLILIAALIIDYKVVLGFFRALQGLFKRNAIYGLVASALTIIFYPFVFLYFLGMALFKKKVREARREADVRRNGQWVDYEELPDKPVDLDTHYEELPPPPPPQPRRRDEPGYDEYFK
ncbi:hypothetical protein [Lewinella sp. JB7]|uniref:hypothetical protein n=1 Tax=Lewinella sp. JB7 TaxID=2962887 RepID=UPI0020C94983|nr:hypothetical protein [Lewinella sp. JB7]MCP9234924.1 hypothetical protein [Lewinella sp. JB7]